MKIQVLCDNSGSWMIPFAQNIVKTLIETGHETTLLYTAEQVERGEILLLLSCEKIFKQLHLNNYNLVAHASDLPKGKGWSPLTWQILEGHNKIPVTLFEAVEKVDAGQIYKQVVIEFNGTELLDEMRNKLGRTIEALIIDFVKFYPPVKSMKQQGEATYYERRKPEDSKLDINKSLAAQFNLFRISDNERYPAYFEKGGVKYILKIFKSDHE